MIDPTQTAKGDAFGVIRSRIRDKVTGDLQVLYGGFSGARQRRSRRFRRSDHPDGPAKRNVALVSRVRDERHRRQSPADDHTHRVLEIRARHLVSKVRLDNPIVGIAGTAAAGPH